MTFCYEWDKYVSHLWRYAQMDRPDLASAVHNASKKYDRWQDFTTDLFTRLYQEDPQLSDKQVPEFYRELHSRLNELKEFRELRDRTVGDEEYSALATDVVADDLFTGALDKVGPVSSTDDEEEALRLLESLKQIAKDDGEETESYDEIIEDLLRSIAKKELENEEAVASLDDTLIRTIIADAAVAVRETIDEQVSAAQAFAFGAPGTGAPPARAETRRVAQHLGRHIKDKPQIKEIIKHAGRLRREMRRAQRSKPDPRSQDIAGVKLGAELDNVLPDEFALANRPETRMLFMDRFASGSLQQLEILEREKKEQGPIVVCVDTSWSMEGERAAWAAGVALAFFEAAVRQKRAFAIIQFHTDVKSCDVFLPRQVTDIDALVDKVMIMQASGGTSFGPALAKAAEVIRAQGAFEKADVVFITDGEALDDLAAVQRDKEQLGFRIYSIYVGGVSWSSNLRAVSDMETHVRNLLDDSPLTPIFAAV